MKGAGHLSGSLFLAYERTRLARLKPWGGRRQRESWLPDYPPRPEIELDDSWQVAQGMYEGRPVILRYREGAVALAGHPQFGHHAGVVIAFNEPQPNGYPGSDEIDALNAFEET